METFKKRQKEMLRLERQRDKAAKRLARKQQRLNPSDTPEENSAEGEFGTGEAGLESDSTVDRPDAAEHSS